MHVNVEPGSKYQYFCPKCGYKREGLLDHPTYSWSCPKCGPGNYNAKAVQTELTSNPCEL